VLQAFGKPIELNRRLTNLELGRVRASVSDPGVLYAVDHYGLAEYLGAGPEALDKFGEGEIANPVGHALVQAAIDWRRSGLTRPVSKDVLVATLPAYLANRQNVPRTNQTIEEGLAWATEKINETVALLGQNFTDPDRPVFEAFDYLIDQPTIASIPVPDPMWTCALEQAKSTELINVGIAANRVGKPAIAKAAYQQAIDEGDSKVTPMAALNLGSLLKEQGDLEGAKTAWQRAIASGHTDAAPKAATKLGYLLEEQGDLAGAKAAY
jgi:tetratricopeptide (TPR) repeat protein